MTKVLTASRRTIMDGEVVTFATAFKDNTSATTLGSVAILGPFVVSASRNAVMVHRAELRSDDDFATFKKAIDAALAAMNRLKEARYGAASLYATEPQEVA